MADERWRPRLQAVDANTVSERWQATPSSGAHYIPPNPVLAWWTSPAGEKFAWVADCDGTVPPVTYREAGDGYWEPAEEGT